MSSAADTPVQTPAHPGTHRTTPRYADVQPGLHGITPAEAEVTARFGIAGVLQRDALLFRCPDKRPHLQVLIGQHVDGHPEAHHVLCTVVYPAGAAGEQLAADMATALSAGTAVLATGTGLMPDIWRGETVLRLVHCIGVARQR